MKLFSAPLAETAAALRSGTLDLVSHVETACARLDELDQQVQAFLPEPARRERLLAQARQVGLRYPVPSTRPPLYGVLVGVKDVFRADGFATRAGSALPPELFAGPEADAVALLRRAGALVLGKTVSTEFAHAEPGPTRNPHNPAHTPGGSSSGSAAAVAAGLCPLALGTQTVGSVIRPAAFCGVVGCKPSHGRVAAGGLIFYSRTVDHVGWFTQDAAGVALVAGVLCSGWRSRLVEEAASRLPVIGIPEGPYVAQATDEALKVLEVGARALIKAGYQVRAFRVLEDIQSINTAHRRLVAAELAQEHREWFPRYERLYRPRTVAAIRLGQGVTAEELELHRASRLELRSGLDALMTRAGIDLWISPPAPGQAPRGLESTGDAAMNLPWTHAGVPALSLPAGLSAEELPMGLQFAGRFGLDEALAGWALRLARAISGP
jgi:Asp-tRNA(Asn)/Glu-tRNA(Gln) amidotransferase A subunit family amidase